MTYSCSHPLNIIPDTNLLSITFIFIYTLFYKYMLNKIHKIRCIILYTVYSKCSMGINDLMIINIKKILNAINFLVVLIICYMANSRMVYLSRGQFYYR